MGAQTRPELVGGRRKAGPGDGDPVQGRHRDPTDLVVMAVGIRPNTELAEKMRLHVQPRHRGQRHPADRDRPAHLRVGECAAHRGIAYGLVAPLFEQGKVAANHLAQFGIGRYTGR
jgi:nitrite reductase (NADH) large subunit